MTFWTETKANLACDGPHCGARLFFVSVAKRSGPDILREARERGWRRRRRPHGGTFFDLCPACWEREKLEGLE